MVRSRSTSSSFGRPIVPRTFSCPSCSGGNELAMVFYGGHNTCTEWNAFLLLNACRRFV
jgi:hypothetical protein